LFTVLEVSVKWGCTQAQILDWAIADDIELVAGFPPVKLGEEQASGLMSVAGSEVRPLFRPFGGAAKKVYARTLCRSRPGCCMSRAQGVGACWSADRGAGLLLVQLTPDRADPLADRALVRRLAVRDEPVLHLPDEGA
jgi:hypothetical protein